MCQNRRVTLSRAQITHDIVQPAHLRTLFNRNKRMHDDQYGLMQIYVIHKHASTVEEGFLPLSSLIASLPGLSSINAGEDNRGEVKNPMY